jgi:AcrR family transcriptional regulator
LHKLHAERVPDNQGIAKRNNAMAKVSAAKNMARRGPARSGRPPKELAGEVEERILGAARQVFLERGFDGASIDEIAEVARSGKPTIYARFHNKGALFAAVVKRGVLMRVEQFKAEVPSGPTFEERLTSLALAVLQWVLVSSHIGLMRLAISESRRFPDLAASVGAMARERGRQSVTRLLAEMAQADGLGALPAFGPERIATTTLFFLDLVILPLLIRALLGENLDQLQAEMQPHVARSVAFFLAAAVRGGVD